MPDISWDEIFDEVNLPQAFWPLNIGYEKPLWLPRHLYDLALKEKYGTPWEEKDEA